MAVRQARRGSLPKQRRPDEDNDTLTRLGGLIVWIGVPLVAWAALVWAGIQAARSML
jgi:hypothetical protein